MLTNDVAVLTNDVAVLTNDTARLHVFYNDLLACGASDGFVTDFEPVLSVFFRDPDGLARRRGLFP